MRTMRAKLQGTQVAVFLSMVLLISVFTVVLSPRSTHAEGPLFGTVRCLVQSLFWTACPPSEPVAPAPSPTSPRQPEGPTPAGPARPGESQNQTNQGTSSDFKPKPIDESSIPGEVHPMAPAVKPIGLNGELHNYMSEEEALAYFNSHSKYAVAGAHNEAASATVVQRSGEGWRLLDIAWYWWGIAAVLLATVFLSGKHVFLRKI